MNTIEEYWQAFDGAHEFPACTCCRQLPTVRPYLDLFVATCDCARTAASNESELREEWEKRNTRLRLAERTERDMPPCPKCSQQPTIFGPVDDGLYVVSCAKACRAALMSRSLGGVKYAWREWVEQETPRAEAPSVGLTVNFNGRHVGKSEAARAHGFREFFDQKMREIADANALKWFGDTLSGHITWNANGPRPIPLHRPLGLLRNEPGMHEAAATVALRPVPRRTCSACAEPEHPGRKLFPHLTDSSRGFVLTCGDCIASGVPLAKQPVNERPHLERYHAWETPSWEGVG